MKCPGWQYEIRIKDKAVAVCICYYIDIQAIWASKSLQSLEENKRYFSFVYKATRVQNEIEVLKMKLTRASGFHKENKEYNQKLIQSAFKNVIKIHSLMT